MSRLASRRLVLAVALGTAAGTAAAGCASAGTAPIESAAGTTQSTVRVDGASAASTAQVQLTHTDAAVETDLAIPADRAFAALPSVYEGLGLKINTAVSDTRTVGVSGVRLRRVGKDPMSRFLTCGSDVTGTPLADSYAVTLTVMSRVTPTGTGASMLSTQVLGTAQPMSVSGTAVTCQSTGALEERIAKSAQLRSAS